jgi:diguanylate cyclase (GGDEF)-like protein
MPPIANLDNFPESPYAEQLRTEPFPQRFPPPLEELYLDEHMRRIKARARIWTALSLVLAVAFSVVVTLEERKWSPAVLAHWFVILPVAVVMTWLAWSPGRMPGYMRVIRVLAPLLGFSVAVVVAQAVSRGFAEEMGSLMLLMIATFFFVGLLPHAATLAGLSILAGFASAAPVAGVPMPLYLKCLAILSVGAAAGVLICRDVDRSYRKRFLEERLIGELVDRDALTGLKNRRALDGYITRIWQQCLRNRNQLAVLMIDIDFFKRYNDRYGHQSGDVTLRKVAEVVKEFARRPLDIAARYGGEEFVIVIFDCAATVVHEIAEKLRVAVANLHVEHADSECGREVTVSIGAAIVQPTIGRRPQGAIQLADEALYRAKRNGRNCCVIEGQAAYEALVTGRYQSPSVANKGL